jgi:hypothetical protein
MNYVLRLDTGKIRNEKKVYEELGEYESSNNLTLSQKFEYNKKSYAVSDIVQSEDVTYLDVKLVEKNYKDNIKQVYRHDRFKHQIFETKDGEETRDKNGKVIRKWDKEGKLVFGEPYPTFEKAAI